MPIVNVHDLRAKAKRKLPKAVFEYIDGGAYTELTQQRNRDDLDALAINETVMRDVSKLVTETTMIGDRAAMPLAIGPVGMAGLAWPNGEVEAVEAAEAFGVPLCLSGFSIASIEDLAKAATRPFWSQLYMMNEQAVNESLIGRADAAGARLWS